MKRESGREPRPVGIAVMLLAISTATCDRSLRQESFVRGELVAAPDEVPTRVRPTPPAVGMQPEVAPGGDSHGAATPASDGGVIPLPPRAQDAGSQTPATVPDDLDGGAGTPNPAGPSSSQAAPDPSGSKPVEPVPTETDSTAGPEVSAPPSSTEQPPAQVAFSKSALLRAATQCAVEQYGALRDSARALASEIAALTHDASRLASARQVFGETMGAFQRVELFRVGPSARAMDPGGEELRDQIYSFPLINRCQIDRNLVSQVYATDFSAVLLNARGLGALEYLLFERGESNTCSAGIDINAKGTWAALDSAELEQRRSAYADVVANDILVQADRLVEAWDEDGGNFTEQVLAAGNGSTVYSTQQSALNAWGHALFYLEKEVKDYKLGWPLGIVAECTSGSCPYAAELPYSGLSARSIEQNLIGFRLLFEGCEDGYQGIGFDDWLTAVDPEGDLGSRMLAGLEGAELAVRALPRPLEDAFYDAPDEARQVHAAVKRVTDLLKTEFISVLNLELPMTAEGDND